MPLIGQVFTILHSVDSTNNYAMAQVHAGLATHGNTYLSIEQTSGKGQRGKAWKSIAGENITMSIVLKPGHIILSEQFFLNLTIALGCYDLFKDFAGKETSIKWPNDIYLCDKKAGGVLIENIIKGYEWRYAIAGIGLNINQLQFSPDLPNATSLKNISGSTYNIVDMAKELCGHLQYRFDQLQNNRYEYLLNEYNAVLYKRNQMVVLKHNNISFQTVIKGVNKKGFLITKNIVEHEFKWGDIEWVME